MSSSSICTSSILSTEARLWLNKHDPSCELLKQVESDPIAMKKLNDYIIRCLAAESGKQQDQQDELDARQLEMGEGVQLNGMIVEMIALKEEENGFVVYSFIVR